MKKIRHALLASALLGAISLAPTAHAAADTTAVAINTKDGFEVFRLAFHIQRTMSDVVDDGNAAVAFSSCTECQTVALAIQAVLIMSDPSEVTTENLALAINYQCTSCETLASAYQFVFTTGGPVHFTAEGNKRIAEIRHALLELRKTDLTIQQIQAKVDELMDQLREVLATQLVPAGQPEPKAPSTQASPSPTPTERPTASPSPSASVSPDPDPSPSP